MADNSSNFGFIGGAIQGLAGVGQAIGGAIQEKRAERKLEKLIAGYQPNQSIMDYYNKALARYNVNPYEGAMYRAATQGAGRGLTTGISALNDRRSVLGGISQLVQGYSDASLRAAATAEGQQGQALGQLGQAAGMKTAEEKYPFELKANLYGAKAAGGAQIMNAGLQNIMGAGSNLSQMAMLNQMYGGGNSSYRGGRGSYAPESASYYIQQGQ